ncbi:hypothetical protein N4G70_07160 [Streptomyces sp. ASQP_92]|uniref:hypothetical protein n=1 Tax=Streptomyces sp. ASQP_92 TaxID=2979116 RepID=UPI0021BFE743|nr:hypothetical protein [Streptomyces sp. ASQP_92]MCT9088648.1 hypothetical protein [Streptomyces sp. ASQP_92]
MSRAPAEAPAGAPAADHGGPALELLVHGVGGTSPQEMLGDPRTVRVTGDDTAAIHRRSQDADAEAHPERYRDRPVPEAYVWCNLTSGNSARALWLLLLPFMVINLAHWMRPPAAEPHWAIRLYGVLVRLIALSLTVLLVAAACEVALDLTAWQCAGSATCSRSWSWPGFISVNHHGWWAQPGRRLALAALAPTGLTVLLWYLSNRTWSAYESQQPLGEASAEDSPQAPPRPAFSRPGFWYGRRLVARLRAAHTAAGFLTTAAAVTVAAARYDHDSTSAVRETLGLLLESTLLLAGLVVVGVVCRRGRTESRLDERLDKALTAWLPATSLSLLALALLYASWGRPDWTSAGTLPGDRAFGFLAFAQGVLVVALAAVAKHLRHRAPGERTALRGLGGPAVAMLACALGGVMTGGVAQRVADWLDHGATPGMDPSAYHGPPPLLTWQASVIPALFVLLVPVLLYFGVRTWRTARADEPRVMADYPTERPDTARTRRIAAARAMAGLTDRAPLFLGIVSGASLLLGAAALVGAWWAGEVPARAADGAPAPVGFAADAVQSLGSWCTGLGFLLFVTWGRRAYKDAAARRTVGILWDVGTFWPRAAHPFAPPCYAERAVPDLAWRMNTWTGRTGGRLVISGHSQGSVLAAAAVWQLPAATRRRVALLTYGCPVERLYGRWFPTYFGPAPLAALHQEVHCWRNLWRATDPIGGPVRTGGDVDKGPLLDPVAYGRTSTHPLPAPVLGHSDYQADPAFARERALLLAALASDVPNQRVDQGSSGRSSG